MQSRLESQATPFCDLCAWALCILVGGLEHFYDFPYTWNVIVLTDELHHFSERFKAPTSIWRFTCPIQINGLRMAPLGRHVMNQCPVCYRL